jgi:hypothetical protein
MLAGIEVADIGLASDEKGQIVAEPAVVKAGAGVFGRFFAAAIPQFNLASAFRETVHHPPLTNPRRMPCKRFRT